MTPVPELVRAPRGPLARFVSEVRAATPAPTMGSYPIEHLPDGGMSLLFRVTQASRAVGGSRVSPLRGDLSVAGPRTRALYKTVEPIPLFIRFVFKPGGAYPFFGVPLSELVDRVVHLEDLWGAAGTRLLDGLMATEERDTAIARIEEALVERLQKAELFEPAAARFVRKAVRLISEPWPEEEGPRVEVLARRLGLSVRHLRRTFLETVGLGPKRYARIVRFQRLLQRASASGARWAELAFDAGYFDQRHLIADFRALAGTTPTSFQRRHAGQGASKLFVRCGTPVEPRPSP